MKHLSLKTLILLVCVFVSTEAMAALDYVDATFVSIDDSASTVNEFKATFEVEDGGVKVADGEIIANNLTGLFAGEGLEFSANTISGNQLIRLTLNTNARPDGLDPVSTADVTFTITPLTGYGSVGLTLSSSGSTWAVDNINSLTFTGTSASIQDDEAVVDMISGVDPVTGPVAFSSGSDIDFIVGNWDHGSSGFLNATHSQNWSFDAVNGLSTSFIYETGEAGTIARERLVWGVEIEEVVDMKITKSVDDPNPEVGSTVTFTLMVENIGVQDATDVNVTDIIPSGFTYVPGSISGADVRDETSPSGSGLNWTINNFNVGDPVLNLTFEAIVNPP